MYHNSGSVQIGKNADLEEFDVNKYYGRTRQPKNKLKLYKALKIGYTRDLKKQQKALKKYGYVIDRDLTNPRERIVAFNPFDKKLLFIDNGTDAMNQKDLYTDLVLGTGAIKQTERFMDDKNALTKARKKYDVKPDHINVVGHSLGGNLTNYLTPSGAHGYTYNAAFAPNQKVRSNVQNFRTHGDIFSTFAPKETTKELENTAEKAKGPVDYLLKAHALENIKDLPVYF
jgi:hypothetical protein